MDILIHAKQGAGKTTIARQAAATYLRAKSYDDVWKRIKEIVVPLPSVCDHKAINAIVNEIIKGEYAVIIFEGLRFNEMTAANHIAEEVRANALLEYPLLSIICVQQKD